MAGTPNAKDPALGPGASVWHFEDATDASSRSAVQSLNQSITASRQSGTDALVAMTNGLDVPAGTHPEPHEPPLLAPTPRRPTPLWVRDCARWQPLAAWTSRHQTPQPSSPPRSPSPAPSLLLPILSRPPRSYRRFPTMLHLYQSPRLFGRRSLYLGVRQGQPMHAVTHHRFRRPCIILHHHLHKTHIVATVKRLTFQQACVWTSSVPRSPVHPPIITGRHPPKSVWGLSTRDASDRLDPRFHTDMYEWRPTRLVGEVPRQLGIVIGWVLLRKDRLEYRHQDETPIIVMKRQEEVVAVAGHTSPSTGCVPQETMPRNGPWSLALEKNRLFTLRFLGRGRTGELGEGWEVNAIITWLGLWCRI